MMGCTTAPGEKTLAPARALHKDHTYELVSKVAYLIGVPLRIFENEHEPPKLELYDQLERDKNARIIRNLCIIRTAIERNYKRINDAMRMECRGLLSMPELIPSASLQQLSDDGVNFITKFSTKLCHHVIEVNRLISDRINNCKSLFPVWINWAYLKELFLMPDGLTESGTKAAAGLYYANLSYYPYQMYINWAPADEGNILYSDRKFADLLYQWHCDAFTEYSKVSDAGAFVKNNIYDFVNASEKTVIVVDCENSDPYKLCATLRNLDREIMQKITTILLFDDIHTVTAWRILESYTDIPVEHIMTERIKQNKSLVDIKLTARACQEHYQNHVDSFVIVSSDSDYPLKTFLISQRKGKGLSGRRKGAFLMDKHPRCGTVLQLANKQQTADCRRNVDRPQSPVGALRSCGFVQVSNQHDSAPGSLCNVSQTAEDGTDFICPVHVHICAQKRLYRVNDNKPCVVLPDCPCYALIGKGQRCVPIVNDKHSFKVCFRFHQSGLDGIAQTVLCGLVDDVERLKGLHTG